MKITFDLKEILIKLMDNMKGFEFGGNWSDVRILNIVQNKILYKCFDIKGNFHYFVLNLDTKVFSQTIDVTPLRQIKKVAVGQEYTQKITSNHKNFILMTREHYYSRQRNIRILINF